MSAGSGLKSDGSFVPEFAGQREPFREGHRLSERHGFYIKRLRPSETQEIAEVADVLRELSPVEGPELEPLVQIAAGKLWRWKRLHAWLVANDERLVDGTGRPADVLDACNRLERSLIDALDALALTPASVAALGLSRARANALRSFDLARLSPSARAEVQALAAKLEGLLADVEVRR